MRIACLHTAHIHKATFSDIFNKLDPKAQVVHHVDVDLLARARQNGIAAVRDTALAQLQELSALADVVLCTCSTLGPLVDEAAISAPNIIRIDRPLMEQACRDGARILVAICLESTRSTTLSLLSESAKKAGRTIEPTLVICADAWPFFESGNIEDFAKSIASVIKKRVQETPDFEAIILAQGSMRAAEANLADLPIPVRSAPVLAAEYCLDLANTHRSK